MSEEFSIGELDNTTFQMSSSKPFNFGIYKSSERLRQLVDSEYLSDVAFLVGSTGQLIFAHKMIISMASEVFYAQFNGNFAEASGANSPVVIEDIEPETFLTILKYIYCDEIFLTNDNLLEVHYAAQKYLLRDLIERCDTFIKSKIDESNALTILNDNHRHKFASVDEKCLTIIRDNPLFFFNLPLFIEINQQTLELIAASEAMNCKRVHLQDAIEKWEEQNGIEECDIVPKLVDGQFQCLKLPSFSAFTYVNSINSCIQLSVSNRKLYLYGLGLYIGTNQIVFGENLLLKVDITGNTTVSVSQKVELKSQQYTHEVLFERVSVTNRVSIKVAVSGQINTVTLLGFDAFVPTKNLVTVIREQDYYGNYKPSPKHCIAYLLYNVA